MTSLIWVTKRPRDPAQLTHGELGGVAVDPPFGPAKRDVNDCRLPRHQRGQGGCVVLVDGGMIAESALHWASGLVVLNPISHVVKKLSIIGLGDQLHLDDPAWRHEDLSEPVRQIQDLRGLRQVVATLFEHRWDS